MSLSRLDVAHHSLVTANEAVNLAVLQLQTARHYYDTSALPAPVRRARVVALDAKIAALRDVHANPVAHPWIGDF